MSSVRRLALLLLAAFALAACGGNDVAAPETQAAATNEIESLDNILALRSDFEADAGKTRVIILLSPT